MLNKYDFKYILKRVLVFIIIGFIMGFMGSCEAHALDTYMMPYLQTICENSSSYSSGDWRGCQNGAGNYVSYLRFNNDGRIPEGFYDLGFNIRIRAGQNIAISIKDVSCQINGTDSTMTYTDSTGTQYYTGSGQYYTVRCDNVPITNGINQLFVQAGSPAVSGNYFYVNTWHSVIPHGDSNTNQAVNEVNNTLNDSTIDTGSTGSGGAFGNMEQSQAQNGTISSLVLMPITLLQKILNGFNGSCSGVNLGTIFDYEFILPCINPGDYIGIIWNIIDTICAGFIAYSIGKRMVVIFNNLTNLKDGGLAEAYD